MGRGDGKEVTQISLIQKISSQVNIGCRGTRLRAEHTGSGDAFSEPAVWDRWASAFSGPQSDHEAHHRDVSQPHRGRGPGTAHCILSMAHRHGCSQAGWPCGPFDVSQALAPGSCSNQPKEGKGDSHTEVLGRAEGGRHSERPRDHQLLFFPLATEVLESQDRCLFSSYWIPRLPSYLRTLFSATKGMLQPKLSKLPTLFCQLPLRSPLFKLFVLKKAESEDR